MKDEANMYLKYIPILIVVLLFSCTQTHRKTDKKSTFSNIHPPENIYIEKHVRAAVDTIFIYYEKANHALSFADSIGSKIYYEKIFSVISEFDEETKSVLLEWQAYNDLIMNINSEYEAVFTDDIFGLEAEELREELTDYEESILGDSTTVSTELIPAEPDSNLIPLQINNRVELALKYFQTKGRKVFTIWLERSGKYEALIKSVLKEYDLPENLLYLAMIESGFNPKAYSYARASGLWQFIYSTGKYYGLRANWWFDQRRDPLLATHAAARHLRDLYDRFGDWYLALAGYNCNPRKIENRIRQYNTRDFWKLKRLPRQTRNYIPTFIAANIIAQDPQKYGFSIKKLEPVSYDTVHVSESVDLQVVADCVDTTFRSVKEINPAVKRWCTPPGVKNFVLNIPKGKKQQFFSNYAKIPDSQKRSWVRHKVRAGETLSTIARKYGSTINVVKSYNKIRGTRIYAGKYLLIPVPQNKNYYSYHPIEKRKKTIRRKSAVKSVPNGYRKVTYLVKKGDTLGEIAEIYHTRASKIRSWNGLYYGQHIYPNQKLNIWVPQNFQPSTSVGSRPIAAKQKLLPAGSYHVVKYGDTLWDIAQKYNIEIANLKKLNNKRTNKIKPGEKLIIKRTSGG